MEKHKKFRLHPYFFIILSFFSVILIGTLLLFLPISAKGQPLSFVDALFSATSAVCVTGLSVINVSVELSIFGKIVMAILMEIGGLSFITICCYFFTIIGVKIGITNRFLVKEALNQNSLSGIVRLVNRIIIISLIIQIIGVILNYIALMEYYNYDFVKTLGVSIFHSIASFNNAGFDVFGDSSMIPFKDNILLNISTVFLIISGGLGFIVIDDIVKKRSLKKLNFHSKIVILSTTVLIVCGTLFFKIAMWDDITWLQAVFSAVTCRTAGFTTVDMSTLPPSAYIISIVLMFIGASPCSTGGGIKTTTLFVMIVTVIYYAYGKKPKAFNRSIANGSIFKAFVLFGTAVMIVLSTTFIIGLIQPNLEHEKLLFEVVSGFSTTGLSMGITTSLNSISRVVMCLLMFAGRIGPLTIIGLINNNLMTDSKENIQYVEERVIVG